MLEEFPSSLGYPTTNNLSTSDVGPNDCDTVFKFPKSCQLTKDMSMAIEIIFDSSVIYEGTPLHGAELECSFMRGLNNLQVIIFKTDLTINNVNFSQYVE